MIIYLDQNLFGHPVDPYRLAASSQNGQSHVVLTPMWAVGLYKSRLMNMDLCVKSWVSYSMH